MSIPKDIIRDNPCLSDWCILSGYRGSIAHGLYVPQENPDSIDDKDAMAVCIPPIDYYFGFNTHGMGKKGVKEIKKGVWDIVVYEFKKIM
mgnify:CR=1 FL=1